MRTAFVFVKTPKLIVPFARVPTVKVIPVIVAPLGIEKPKALPMANCEVAELSPRVYIYAPVLFDPFSMKFTLVQFRHPGGGHVIVELVANVGFKGPCCDVKGLKRQLGHESEAWYWTPIGSTATRNIPFPRTSLFGDDTESVRNDRIGELNATIPAAATRIVANTTGFEKEGPDVFIGQSSWVRMLLSM